MLGAPEKVSPSPVRYYKSSKDTDRYLTRLDELERKRARIKDELRRKWNPQYLDPYTKPSPQHLRNVTPVLKDMWGEDRPERIARLKKTYGLLWFHYVEPGDITDTEMEAARRKAYG